MSAKYDRVSSLSRDVHFSIDEDDSPHFGIDDEDEHPADPSFPSAPPSIATANDVHSLPSKIMLHACILVTGLLLGSVTTSLIILHPPASTSPPTYPSLTYLNSSLPLPLLSSLTTTLPPLLRGFDAQSNQAYCGLASTATLLNSLLDTVTPPHDPVYELYAYATQYGLRFDACVNDVIPYSDSAPSDQMYDAVMLPPYGTTLRQIESVVRCAVGGEGVVTAHEITPEVTVDAFRAVVVDAIDSGGRVLVNFHRSGLKQKGGGHWSPVAGYDAASDMFLVLDVAKYKYPSYFVSAAMLWEAVGTVDECGVWGWPEKQEGVDPNSAGWMEALGCEASYRGVVTVKLGLS